MLLPLFLTASLLSNVVSALSASDISQDLPISSLLSSADSHLAKGQTNDALVYYDVAISRDPSNYLSLFKRGATYLSLGRTTQALSDFDKVLEIRPGFEGALLQRARLRSRTGDWDGAKQDYIATSSGAEDLIALEEAREAATLAFKAEETGNWEDCINYAGTAILVANKVTSLRQTRAHCRFERGEMEEGVSDLMHVLQLQPGQTDPHIQISSILFYALRDTEKGMDQIRKCLHSDPDSKTCRKLHRREKQIDKELAKVNKFFEKKQYASAVKLLVPTGEDAGLIQEIKDDVKELREAGTIPEHAPDDLVARVVEMACEAYFESKSKKAAQYCDEALALYEHSLHGLLSKAQRQMDAEEFEACIATLTLAKEHHPSASQVDGLLRKAQIALKRSKEKDYYKVLGVPNDADERQIKSAFRKMTKQYHPDKAKSNGMTNEAAQKKMAEVNEAYEVLSDPELRARFDRGDDPNSNEPQHGSPFGGGGGHHQFFQQGGQPFRFQQGGGGGSFQFNF